MRVPFEKAGVTIACTLIPRLSLKTIMRLSRIMAAMAFIFDRYGRKVAEANLEIVPAEGALKHLFKAIKNGHSVGLLIDQHVEMRDGGIWIDFFGLKACISQSAAMLAKRFNRPIVFGWSRPLKDGCFSCELGKVFPETDTDAGNEKLRTIKIAKEFEHVIKLHPSLWCINYRRWRYLIPGEASSRYPFYAKPARAWQCPPCAGESDKR